MASGQRPADALFTFIAEGAKRGIYRTPRLYETSLRLLLANAPPNQRPRFVDEVARRLKEVKNPFSTPITDLTKELSANSVAAYRSRLSRVLTDFARWSDDLEGWSPKNSTKEASRQLALESTSKSMTTPIPFDLPDGGFAELRRSSTLTPKDLRTLAKLLRSYAEHLEVQAAALSTGEPDV